MGYGQKPYGQNPHGQNLHGQKPSGLMLQRTKALCIKFMADKTHMSIIHGGQNALGQKPHKKPEV